MERRKATYKVIISPDTQTGTGTDGFTAFVPKLGIADDGYTIEEALANVKELAKFHIKCLVNEGQIIPAPDTEQSFVTSAVFDVTANKKNLEEFASAYV